MIKTINLSAEIPLSRELHITLPPDTPIGRAEIAVTVLSPSQTPARTLADLARSEFFGMWRDRDDLKDSFAFARMLRSEGWRRPS